MKNNKGFSLVELIIVIAIMAILVGVMAPQLIKYIEKSNVSADTQLADAVHSAVLTAGMDPEVIADATANTTIAGLATAQSITTFGTSDKFEAAVLDILGCTSGAEVTTSLKSFGATDVQVRLDLNKCSVWLPGTDASGSKGQNASTSVVISVY